MQPNLPSIISPKSILICSPEIEQIKEQIGLEEGSNSWLKQSFKSVENGPQEHAKAEFKLSSNQDQKRFPKWPKSMSIMSPNLGRWAPNWPRSGPNRAQSGPPIGLQPAHPTAHIKSFWRQLYRPLREADRNCLKSFQTGHDRPKGNRFSKSSRIPSRAGAWRDKYGYLKPTKNRKLTVKALYTGIMRASKGGIRA